MMKSTRYVLASAFVLVSTAFAAAQVSAPALRETENTKLLRVRSRLLTRFWGRPIYVEAGVVLPPDRKDGERFPVCFNVHGFGGSHRAAWSRGQRILRAMTEGSYPRMIYVYLNGSCPQGHHEFADSVNNGPWGAALTREFVPVLEKSFPVDARPRARFLTGHSSGGWSTLWLQITYPDFFGGTWSTAPDPVDFRDFTGIDIYKDANAFVGPDGKPVQLMRARGKFVRTIRQFVEREIASKPFGGQFSSFDYVFSPRGDDGRPMPLFDRKTGAIDPDVARAWQRYDIRLVLERNWKTLGPKLAGKLRIWIGTQDTFRLEGACKLLAPALKKLGSDAEILFVEGRDHGTLRRPHPKFWPNGMIHRIHHEMYARWKAAR